jgi:hypothetical protein
MQAAKRIPQAVRRNRADSQIQPQNRPAMSQMRWPSAGHDRPLRRAGLSALAPQLAGNHQRSPNGRRHFVSGLESKGAEEVPLALVHGHAGEKEAAALHCQPAVDSERRPRHLKNQWCA